jgi:hypothetical protein
MTLRKESSGVTVRFELDTDGEVLVAATFVGFDISVAEHARVKVGRMTGVSSSEQPRVPDAHTRRSIITNVI